MLRCPDEARKLTLCFRIWAETPQIPPDFPQIARIGGDCVGDDNGIRKDATDRRQAATCARPVLRGGTAMTRPMRENLFRADPVDRGAQPESFSVFDMPGPATPARIGDFDAATDALHLHLLDAALFGLSPGDWPVPTLAHDSGSNTTAVAVNGVIVALIEGDPNLDPADISVIALV